MMDTALHLGGFQEAADQLSVLSQHSYSRQAVHQLWKRRSLNGFPDRKTYLINGYTKLYFDMEDITQWYGQVRDDITNRRRSSGQGQEPSSTEGSQQS